MVIYLADHFTRQHDVTLRKSARLSVVGGQRTGRLPASASHAPVWPGTLFADPGGWRVGQLSAAELNTLYAEATLI